MLAGGRDTVAGRRAGIQNVALFAIDVFGIYRYLIRKKAVS